MTDLEKRSNLAYNNTFRLRVIAALAELSLSYQAAYQAKPAGTATTTETARAQYGRMLMAGGLESNLDNLCLMTAANSTIGSSASIPASGDTALMTCTATDDQLRTATVAAFDTVALAVTSGTSSTSNTSSTSGVTAGITLK